MMNLVAQLHKQASQTFREKHRSRPVECLKAADEELVSTAETASERLIMTRRYACKSLPHSPASLMKQTIHEPSSSTPLKIHSVAGSFLTVTLTIASSGSSILGLHEVLVCREPRRVHLLWDRNDLKADVLGRGRIQ